MNCCHLCSIVGKKQQMVQCNNCPNEYCVKCASTHLSYPVIQKVFPQHSIEEIQEMIKIKKWLCFSCLKVCICKLCKGVGMANVQKVILGKRDNVSLRKNVEDYRQYYERVEMFKSIDFESMSPYEKQHFMSKVMLYARPKNDTVISLKEISMRGIMQSQKQQKKQEFIMIDSDENHEYRETIEAQGVSNKMAIQKEMKEQNVKSGLIVEENPEKRQRESQKMQMEIQNIQTPHVDT